MKSPLKLAAILIMIVILLVVVWRGKLSTPHRALSQQPHIATAPVDSIRASQANPINLTPAPTSPAPSPAPTPFGPSIFGVVTDLDSATPLPNVRVSLADPKTTLSPSTFSASNGSYTLRGLPDDAPIFRLVAHRDGYVPAFVQIQAYDAANPVDFYLERAGTVLVRVADFKNNPLAGAAIQIKDPTGLLPVPSVFTDSAGHAVLRNISRADPPLIVASFPDRPHNDPAQAKPRFGESFNARLELRLRTPADMPPAAYFGVVTDRQGNALPNITVSIVSNSHPTPDQTTITAGNGAYRLNPKTCIPRAFLKAHAPTWGAHSQPAPSPDPSNPSIPIEVNFSLDKGHTIRGRVVNHASQPVAGAVIETSSHRAVVSSSINFEEHLNYSVWARSLFDQFPHATAAADGSFVLHEVPSEEMILHVSAAGYSTKSCRVRSADAAVITLDPAVSLFGTVIDASTKQPIEKFNVLLRPPRTMEEFLKGKPFVENPARFSDPNGHFEFHNLNPGQQYQVLASAKGYSQKFLREINPAPGSKHLVTIELHPAKTVTFRFIDKQTGKPIRHATIISGFAAQNKTPDWVSIETINVELIGGKVSTPDHNAEITLEEGPNPLLLYVAAPGYTNLSIFQFNREKYADAPDHFTVPLSRGASIFGTVYFNGLPAPNARLSLDSTTPSPISNQEIFTDGEGNYEFTSLPPLSFSLSANETFSRSGLCHITRKVSLRPGEAKRVNIGDDLGNSALYGILAAGNRSARRLNIMVTPEFPWDYTNLLYLSELDGSYKLMGLKDGKYMIRVLGQPSHESVIEVNGLTPLDIPLPADNPASPRPPPAF